MFRMNIRQTKGTVWMLNILAIICISFLFIMTYKEKKQGKFKPNDVKIYKKKLQEGLDENRDESRGGDININDYKAIWTAPISGIKKQVVERAPEEIESGPDDTPLSDILQVQVIMKSSVASESRVRLFYSEIETGDEKPFKLDIWSAEGDELKPPYDVHPYFGKIKKIDSDRVIFTFRGEDVALTPVYVSPTGGEIMSGGQSSVVTGIPEEVRTRFPEPPEETVEYKPDHFYLSRKESNYFGTDYGKELKMSPIVAVKNKRTGKTELKLTSVTENSMAAKRGFQSGDVLVSINGIPVHTKAGAINYFKQHPNQGTYVVEYKRNGRPMSKTFVVPPSDE